MTQNLDLDIGGTNTAPLNSNNTDISTTASGSGIYADGYTEQDGVWTWNPASTAITSNYYISNTSVKPSAWPTNDYATPYSAEGGDTYYYTSNNTNDDTRKTLATQKMNVNVTLQVTIITGLLLSPLITLLI